MERIPDRIDSKFRYILLASHRAEQLLRGASPRIERPKGKPSRIAMEEVLRDAVRWGYGPEPEGPAGEHGAEVDAEAEPVEA
ncbi:MAG TPA: DNA-directed RNA polymerase subunit omega [Thermoanaerobaculia bacterium]|jgi:DNA-directed RNA polymerase omega subunit